MSQKLREILKRAQRRLNIARGLQAFGWGVTVGLTIACAVVAVDRLLSLDLGVGRILAVSLPAAVVMALSISLFRRKNLLDAALVLDDKASLKQRISTLVSLSAEERETDAGQALAADVDRRTESLSLADTLPIPFPRRSWLAIVPLMALLAIVSFVTPITSTRRAEAKEAKIEERKRVERETESLASQLNQRRDEINDAKVAAEVKEISAEIEQAAAEIRNDKKMTAEQAALKLSDLAKKLEEKRDEQASVDRMKRALSKLSGSENGPADELQKSLKEGDFQKAAEQVKKLKDELAQKEMDPAKREQLAKQLSSLEEQLKKAASQAERAKQLQASLSPEEAKKKLEELAKDAKSLDKLEKLAESLGECSKCLGEKGEGEKGNKSQGNSSKEFGDPSDQANGEKGDSKNPGDQKSADDLLNELGQAEKMLRELAQDDQTKQTLQDMLDDLNECRSGMCQGQGQGKGGEGNGDGKGNGLGKGQGSGQRPIKEDATRARETQARSQIGKGKSFVTGKVDGPLFGGESQAELQAAVEAAAKQADEATERQPIPAHLKEHTREYFEKLHGQMKQSQTPGK